MMKRILSLAFMLFLAGISAAYAGPDSSGNQVFDKHCSYCHAPGTGHPGTMQLARTRGKDRAVLEERNDLAPDYIKYIVRHGLNAMPPFKPSNITKDDLDALAGYLSR